MSPRLCLDGGIGCRFGTVTREGPAASLINLLELAGDFIAGRHRMWLLALVFEGLGFDCPQSGIKLGTAIRNFIESIWF